MCGFVSDSNPYNQPLSITNAPPTGSVAVLRASLQHTTKHKTISLAGFYLSPTHIKRVFGGDVGMEALYNQGIWIAETLQQRTSGQERFWLVVTHIGDPKAAFLLLFPFSYFINKRAGVAVLWVAAISEWLNLVFKW